jgi:hypothetical protein
MLRWSAPKISPSDLYFPPKKQVTNVRDLIFYPFNIVFISKYVYQLSKFGLLCINFYTCEVMRWHFDFASTFKKQGSEIKCSHCVINSFAIAELFLEKILNTISFISVPYHCKSGCEACFKLNDLVKCIIWLVHMCRFVNWLPLNVIIQQSTTDFNFYNMGHLKYRNWWDWV